MIGYHFLRAMPARHPEDREIVIGETLRKPHPPILTEYGYHASRRVLDAFRLASGPILMKCRLGGTIIHGDIESVASERTALAIINTYDIVIGFCRRCGLDFIGHWDAPEIVMEYLLTAEPDLRAAADLAVKAAYVRRRCGKHYPLQQREIEVFYQTVNGGNFRTRCDPDLADFADYAGIYLMAHATFAGPHEPPLSKLSVLKSDRTADLADMLEAAIESPAALHAPAAGHRCRNRGTTGARCPRRRLEAIEARDVARTGRSCRR